MIGMTAGLDKQVSIDMQCCIQNQQQQQHKYCNYLYSNVLTTAGHNVRRCRHGLGDLKWDEGLVKVAKAHAATCVYKHSKSRDKSHAVVYTLV